MKIPVEEALAALDTDYASEGCTCSDADNSQEEGENLVDDDLHIEIERRREGAGFPSTARMVIGPVWRSPDVSASPQTSMFDNTHFIASVRCLPPIANLQVPQGKVPGTPI